VLFTKKKRRSGPAESVLLEGVTHLKGVVKYLGLIQDAKLTCMELVTLWISIGYSAI
jgi:hypothetical protein